MSCRGVGTGGGGHRGQGPPYFCALALAAASHARTTGDLYLRCHNCPKCPQNAPKNCLKSQNFLGGHATRPPRLAACLGPPVIFIFLRPCLVCLSGLWYTTTMYLKYCGAANCRKLYSLCTKPAIYTRVSILLAFFSLH